jgi:hypothetical protein
MPLFQGCLYVSNAKSFKMHCCGRQLGSASLDLIQRSSETMAGRIAFIELSGLHRLEVLSGLWGDSKVTRFMSTPC